MGIMTKRPMAFWKMGSTPPYYMCDEILEFLEDDRVMVKRSYGNLIVRPISVVPNRKGVEIQKQLEEIKEEHRIRTQELSKEMLERASKLVETNYPKGKATV